MKPTFEIKKEKDGMFMFNLKAANDLVIFTSQSYESKEGAEAGIASVKENAEMDDHYEGEGGS